jgi:hypothetical protein
MENTDFNKFPKRRTYIQINDPIYFLDEAPVIFSSSETSKKNNDVLDENTTIFSEEIVSTNSSLDIEEKKLFEESLERMQFIITSTIDLVPTFNISRTYRDPLLDRLFVDNIQDRYLGTTNSLIPKRRC